MNGQRIPQPFQSMGLPATGGKSFVELRARDVAPTAGFGNLAEQLSRFN